jgi:pilus assembly protein CpaB
MNGRSLGVLLLAVVLGLGAMLATRRFMSKPVVEEETQEIVVAARDFKEEEILKTDMVKPLRMSSKAVPPGAFSSFKDVEDRWVKTTMLEGEPIIEKKLGPKGSPPGLVANIPKGMRAFAIEVNEQSGVSGFILPGHHVDVVRYESNDNKSLRPGETILQDVQVLASGQVFTRSDEKSLTTHTVTLAVTPQQVGILVAAKAKGLLNLSLRGVNDHEVVAHPKPAPEPNEEEKARRLKLEKELEEVKLALARKQAEVPPPPPPPPPPAPRLIVKAPEPRYVLIYRPLLDKKSTDYPAREPANAAARGEMASRTSTKADEDLVPKGFGFGGPAVTGADPDTRGEMNRTP